MDEKQMEQIRAGVLHVIADRLASGYENEFRFDGGYGDIAVAMEGYDADVSEKANTVEVSIPLSLWSDEWDEDVTVRVEVSVTRVDVELYG